MGSPRQLPSFNLPFKPAHVSFSLFLVVFLATQGLHSQTSSTLPIRPTIQVGPGGTISYLEAFPDSNHLLSVDRDDTVGIWLIDGGWEVKHLPVGNEPAHSAAISPDGRVVVTGGQDGRVLRWDVTNERILSDEFHPEPGDSSRIITAITFSPNGNYYASVGQGHFDKVWNAIDGKLVRRIPVSTTDCSIAFIPNSSMLFLDVGDGTVSAQGIADGKEAFRAKVSFGKISHLKIIGTRLVVSSMTDEVSVWEIEGNTLTLLWRSAEGVSGAYLTYDSPDRLLVLWSDLGSEIIIVSFDTGAKIRAIHTKPVSALCTYPRGGIILLALGDQLMMHDINTGKLLTTLTRPEIGEFGVAFSPDDNTVAIGTSRGIDFWRRDIGARERTITTTSATEPLNVSNFLDSQNILAYSSHVVSRISLTGPGKEQVLWRASEPISDIVPSLDGAQILTQNMEIQNKIWTTSSWSIRDVTTGEKLFSSRRGQQPWAYITLSPDQKFVATSAPTRPRDFQCVWRVGQQTPLWCVDGGSSPMAFSPDSQSIGLVRRGAEVQVLKSTDETVEASHSWYDPMGDGPRASHPVQYLTFSRTGNYIAASGSDGLAQLWRTNSQADHITLTFHSKNVGEVAFSSDDRYVIVTADDGISELWDVGNPHHPEHIVSFIAFEDGAWATITPEGYYRASPGELHSLTFRVGNDSFPFEQFDLRLNRPDVVLSRMGNSSKDLIAAYHRAYVKRLALNNVNAEMLSDDFHVPTIEVTPSFLPPSTNERTLHLRVKATDSLTQLKQLNIYINDVPIYGSAGIELQSQHTNSWEQDVAIALSAGTNKVQVSAVNTGLTESLKYTSHIVYAGPSKSKPDLYVVAIGVSNYKDSDYHLDYAAKDARDFISFWQKKKNRFGTVHALPLIDRDATREKILGAREFLAEADVDDEVIVLVAGHGLLDNNEDYYFATQDLDFTHPSTRGLPFEKLEEVVDGIRARKKLMLIDTCQAGEVDKDQQNEKPVAAANIAANSASKSDMSAQIDRLPVGVKARAIPKARAQVLGVTRVGLTNAISLVQELFADLRRGSGAYIITASGGMDFAFEGGGLSNGTFTAAVLEGLNGEASKDHDGGITVSGLWDYVDRRVPELTSGKQKPTIRRENLENDFLLY